MSWQAGESRAAQGSALVISDQKPREHPYRALQYSTVQYSTVQYSTVQYSTVHDNDIAEPHRAGPAQSSCPAQGPRPGPCPPPAPAARPVDLSVSISLFNGPNTQYPLECDKHGDKAPNIFQYPR